MSSVADILFQRAVASGMFSVAETADGFSLRVNVCGTWFGIAHLKRAEAET